MSNEIREQLGSSQAPLADNKARLEEQLQVRVEVEDELAEARRRVETVENELRELDQARMQNDQSVEAARGDVNDARMAAQEVSVRREGFAEQFAETGFELPGAA